MKILHKPDRFVGTDGQKRRIEGTQASVNFAKVFAVTGVSGKKDAAPRTFNDEPASEHFVLPEKVSFGPMLRGNKMKRDTRF